MKCFFILHVWHSLVCVPICKIRATKVRTPDQGSQALTASTLWLFGFVSPHTALAVCAYPLCLYSAKMVAQTEIAHSDSTDSIAEAHSAS